MNPATEKKCPQCDAIISFGADVCPKCGATQPLSPIARKGGGGKVLKGCLIAAAVGFAGIFVIGIIAAIAIPKFAMTRDKAYIASMQVDLRRLATAEAQYRQGHPTYQPDMAELGGFTFTPGVSLAKPIDAGSDGWSATVRRADIRLQCTLSFGDRVPTGGAEGTPVCGSPPDQAR